MASTQSWTRYHGAASATVQANVTDSNWRRSDDETAYTGSPINSSNNENSNPQLQALVFAGTWNSLSALTYKIDNNAPATGLSIVGSVRTAVADTTGTTSTGDPAMSTTGLSANFNTSSSPFGAGTSSTTASGTMYANALRTQLQTTSSYAGGPGDIVSRTITASWTES